MRSHCGFWIGSGLPVICLLMVAAGSPASAREVSFSSRSAAFDRQVADAESPPDFAPLPQSPAPEEEPQPATPPALESPEPEDSAPVDVPEVDAPDNLEPADTPEGMEPDQPDPTDVPEADEVDLEQPDPAPDVDAPFPETQAEEDDFLPSPDPAYTAPLPLPGQRPRPLVQPGNPDSLLGIPQAPDFDTYRLGPGDAFFVNVRQFPDLSFQATLDIQGNVIVPLEGVVSFSGLTLQEAEALITQLYDLYVVNPDVSLTLIAQRGVEVTIVGEVIRPGYYPLTSPQISTALLSAGGITGQADLRDVSIQRRLPGGQILEETVDLFTPLKEGQALPDVALQDGDVIIVERLDPAALDEYDRLLVSRSTLAQPVITVRLLNYGGAGALSAIDLPNGSRFADAIVRAGLNPDTSRLNQIALVRFDEEAGRAVTTLLNGNEAFRGVPSENPPLQNNDVIIVDRTLLARITYALNTFTQPFRDVLGFLLFFDSLSESAETLFGP